jgi:DNA-binding NarL/FixJ family response regulator
MRLVLADDSVLIREGLGRLLIERGFDIVGQANDAEELLTAVRADTPDVAIVDIRMPPTYTDEGIKAAQRIRNEFPQVGVLVLSQYVDAAYALKLIGGGAERLGYLLKQRVARIDDLAEALERVAGGETVIDPGVVEELVSRKRFEDRVERLTQREHEVLRLIAEGRSNQAICDKLVLSSKTVATHIARIFSKLELGTAPDDNRRVLAVLTLLKGSAIGPNSDRKTGDSPD